MKRNKIDDEIFSLEKSIAIHNFIKEKIPNAYVQISKVKGFRGFVSKYVNKFYSGLEFNVNAHKIYVSPYLELDFEYNGVPEKLRVYSIPRQNKLAYIKHNYIKKTNIIHFSRLSINMKNNNFKDDMLNECRIKIMDFIKKHPRCELDQKHLDPKLKKLLAFA